MAKHEALATLHLGRFWLTNAGCALASRVASFLCWLHPLRPNRPRCRLDRVRLATRPSAVGKPRHLPRVARGPQYPDAGRRPRRAHTACVVAASLPFSALTRKSGSSRRLFASRAFDRASHRNFRDASVSGADSSRTSLNSTPQPSTSAGRRVRPRPAGIDSPDARAPASATAYDRFLSTRNGPSARCSSPEFSNTCSASLGPRQIG